MAVNGASPVAFVSEAANPGEQYFIPLSAITITNGTADASAWVTANSLSADSKLVTAVLTSWVQRGLITASA